LIVVLVIIFASTYFFFATAEIPIQQIVVDASQLTSSKSYTSSLYIIDNSSTSLSLSVSFAIYIIAVFSWFGWWFFVIYAGVGLTALPLDMILEYVNRPIRMRKDEYISACNKLGLDLIALKNQGEQVKVDDAEAKRTTGCIFIIKIISHRVGR